MRTLVSLSIIVIALSSVALAVIFWFLIKALVRNTESLRTLIGHVDTRLDTAMVSVQKSIEDINHITGQVNQQMDRVEQIVDHIEQTTRDARTSMRMVNNTVVPMLANAHGIMGGIRKGIDTWNDNTHTEREDERNEGM